jgi:CheY-like chemotaxis protein
MEGTMTTILHIEDENSVRLLYKEVFEELGYNVIQAISGEEAMKLLKGSRPDLIILDLKMPGMGGRVFLEKFHKMKLKIPVVISTAYPHLEDEASALGANAYVIKSGDMTELIERVQGLINEFSRSRHGK